MPTKRRLNQLKSARALAVEACKRRKFEASLVVNSQPEIEDDKLSTADTSDTEVESGTWFWNDSANESDLDTEEGEDGDENESNLEMEESRAVSPKVRKEIKWNKEGENKLCGVYGIGSRATSKRRRKSARELDEQAKQTYDIRALWKQNLDLGMISPANSQVGLGQPPESQPIDDVSSSSSLSKVARDGVSHLSNQKTFKSQQTEALRPK